jgi:hypothetical protein
MGRRIAVSLLVTVAVVLTALAALTACAPSTPGPAALQVPPGCERYLTVAEVQEALGRPVRAVDSDNGEDCRFRLGPPEDETSLAIIIDIESHAVDLPGLRAVDLDALPPHGPQISSYYEVTGGRETLLALSGGAFYKLVATSRATPGLRPQLVALAKKLASRL